MGEMDGAGILVSLFVSAIGFVLFSYGRKMTRGPQMLTGIVLMAFPYFVSGVWVILAIATAILLVLWGLLHLGW